MQVLDEEKRIQPPLRRRIGEFVKATVFTTIPFVVLVVIIAAMVGRGGELVWLAALGLWVLALLAGGGFAIAAKRQTSLGILAGTAVGLVGLVVSCSVVLATPAALP